MSAAVAPKQKKVHYPFWLGGAASCTATLFSHPLDLTKVRMQTLRGSNRGMLRTMMLVVREEGFLALYNGLTASLLRQATYSTVRFAIYDFLKERTQGPLTMDKMVFNSVIAGCVGGVVGNPADIVNIRMQNDGNLPKHLQRSYRNALDGLYRIAKEESIVEFARGLGPNIVRATLMTASQLVSYDVFKALLLQQVGLKDNVWTHFGASSMAGLVATTVCSPFDVVKTRIMNASKDGRSALDVFKLTLRHEGVSAFFKGWTPAFIRLGPHTIVTFMVYEQLKRAWNNLL
ncbi:uncharacterized protein VTP21DRAFT_1623 [Calcarisporiella thermophila]|uniref:uncharacterized protein n=1 Tax=Calcarisporiella thermophila TaxID=911321 RepID=UPI003742CF36